MYNVNLLLYIWDSHNLEESRNWALAYKKIEMPFIPFIGLEIDFPLERNQKIKSIRWSMESDSFTCTLGNEYSLYGVDDPMFEEWIEYYKDHGWSIEGPYPKNE
ncbi:hypothetical protein [Acinetobacter venetianus]|uniref:hypothetical protein n=1 Tax=Acinetobacter venetianus TaxID=52133 RepID=UPI0010A680B8|nr:hypothetical protein [Acinetobacter venetianus]MCR4532591.1 hypothetical protein [Acinetobacter venetianus]MDA1255125.1 hypothetical protein [Pseudomonadota bacterium]